MSHVLGKTSLEKLQQPFLQQDSVVAADYSEKTAREIDTEVRRILDQQYERALAILRDHSTVLRNAAGTLLEKETLTGEELETIRRTTDERVPDRVQEAVLV
jgi:cell division protease FtsH